MNEARGLRAAAAVLLAVAATAPATAAADTLRVIAFSDVDQVRTGDGRGGLERISSVIRAEREAADADTTVLVIHAGDALSPSILSSFDEGAHMTDVLNRVGIDIFVPGNHEFDFGPQTFQTRMDELEAEKLVGNVLTAEGALLPGFSATTTIEVGDVTVGILGVTSEGTRETSDPGDLVFRSSYSTAVDLARDLRADGADFVIAVAHVSAAADALLLRSGAFDMVVSGDDHALAVRWDGEVMLLQSREQGDHLPIADVAFHVKGSDDGRRVSFDPTFRVIDTATIAPDPALDAVVDRHLDALDAGLSERIATVASELDTRRTTVRTREAAFGNLVADAIRLRMGADFALMNGGGIRADRIYQPGTRITRRDVFAELPFGNTVVLAEITGAGLVSALEEGLARLEGTPGGFPQISGGRIVVAPSRPVGQRLVTLEVDGEPIDPTATYRIATNDFLLRGGDGYASLTRADVLVPPENGPLLATVTADHLAGLRRISAAPEGRIVFRQD